MYDLWICGIIPVDKWHGFKRAGKSITTKHIVRLIERSKGELGKSVSAYEERIKGASRAVRPASNQGGATSALYQGVKSSRIGGKHANQFLHSLQWGQSQSLQCTTCNCTMRTRATNASVICKKGMRWLILYSMTSAMSTRVAGSWGWAGSGWTLGQYRIRVTSDGV